MIKLNYIILIMEVIKMTSNEAKAALVDFLKSNRIDQKEFAEMIGKSDVTISRCSIATNL